MTSSLPSLPSVKFPRSEALLVASELCRVLTPHCSRIIVAGSLRRRKPEVGDVEILYIPNFARLEHAKPSELFGEFVTPGKPLNITDVAIDALVHKAVIIQRKNINGHICWGEKNKLATHVSSGIPVDLFSATEQNWWNYVVCRTGSADNNVRIASAAQAKGWKWNPYGPGFTDQEGNTVPVASEQDVFTLVGLPYREPWER